MQKYLLAFIIALGCILSATGTVMAQSTVPPLEEIIRVGDLVDYSVTTTGNSTRTTVTLSGVSCQAGEKLIGIVMSKTITLPVWTGSVYWDLSVGMDINPAMPVKTATGTGNQTITEALSYHGRLAGIVPNWSILTNTLLTGELITAEIGYPAGLSIAMPADYVDYSALANQIQTGVASVSLVYNQSNSNRVMSATGQIAPVCLTDPKWYYIGSTVGMSSVNDGATNYKTVTTTVGANLNPTGTRLMAILAKTHSNLVELPNTDHQWTLGVDFGWYSARLQQNNSNPNIGELGPADRSICYASGEPNQIMRVWNSDNITVYVRPCTIPEASGYTTQVGAQYTLALNPYETKDYYLQTFYSTALHLSGTGTAQLKGVILGYQAVTGSQCSDRYQLGSAIRTDSVPAGNVAPYLSGGQYGEAITGLAAGSYYAVEIVDPAWKQGDSHPASNSYLSQFTTLWDPGPVGSSVWNDPANMPGSCVEDLDHGKVRVYFYTDQTAYSPLYGIRAADPAGNWDNNTGDLNYTVYNAVYTTPPTSCAAKYDIGNLLVQNVQIRADYSDGGNLTPGTHPWQPNQSYMVEISGEPWLDNGSIPSNAVDISIDGGITWTSIDNLQGEFCIAHEGLGNRRLYMTHLTGRTYKLRAQDPDNTYLQNSGYVSYSVYSAVNYDPAGSCSSQFTTGSVLSTDSVAANLEDGEALPVTLVKDNWYIIETIAPPWSEHGTNSGSGDFSGDNYAGRSWAGLLDFPGGACSETTGLYQRLYFRAQYDTYYIRADSTDPTWTNNTGNLSYKLSSATVTNPQDPPPATCEEAYNQQRVLLSVGKLLGANYRGDNLTKLPEGLYAIETLDGPWFNGSELSYDIAYNFDDGIVPMIPAQYYSPVECVVLLSDQKHIRAYLNLTHGADDIDEEIFAYDPSGDYTDNTGSIAYSLYRVTAAGDLPPMPEPPPATTCNSVCIRPDGVLDVPAWLEYGRCSFSKFITFCPYHAEALFSTIDSFNTREPFKTFSEIAKLPDQIKSEFDNYAWDNPTGGGENLQAPTGLAAAWYDILPNLPADSPWNGGKIYITKPMSTVYSRVCNIELKDVLGSGLGGSVCFMMNLLNGIGAIKWMQFILDTVMLIILVLYVNHAWLKQGG